MTTTMVRTYKNTKAFSKDAQRMARSGYQVVSTFQEPSKNKPIRNVLKLFVGGTFIWGASIKGGKVIVTYQGTAPSLPAALATSSSSSSWSSAALQAAPLAPAKRRGRGSTALRAGLLTFIFFLVVFGALIAMALH